jgi:hypothetical protein
MRLQVAGQSVALSCDRTFSSGCVTYSNVLSTIYQHSRASAYMLLIICTQSASAYSLLQCTQRSLSKAKLLRCIHAMQTTAVQQY